MTRSPVLSRALALAFTFLLGVVATLLVSSSHARAPLPERVAPQVTPAERAERRAAPNGKGEIQLLARGRQAFLGRLTMAPGGAVPKHRDATEEYIHVLEGHGTITIDGVSSEVRPGTTIFMPADAEVSYQNGDQEMIAIQVFAGPAPAAKYDAWKPVE